MKETAILKWGSLSDGEKANASYLIITYENENAAADADGVFAVKPTLKARSNSLTFSQDISGVSIVFDALSNVYATDITLVAHLEADEVEFTRSYGYTNERAFAFLRLVPDWQDDAELLGIDIVVNACNKGGRKITFDAFAFGKCYIIDAHYLTALSVVSSIDYSGASAPFSTMTTTINAYGLDGILGIREKMELSTNVRDIGEYYVDSIVKRGANQYEITAIDALGCLAAEKFGGAYYGGSQAANALLLGIAGDYYINYSGASYSPSGVSVEADKRTAILQIATAGGAIVNSNKKANGIRGIYVERPSYSLTSNGVGRGSTFSFPETKNEDITTAYTITSHSFVADANGDIVIGNARYKDTRTDNNYNTGASGKATKKTLSSATLITNSSTLSTARTLFANRLRRRKIWKGSYIWKDGEEGVCGAVVRVPLREDGFIYGNVASASLSFSGASVRVDAEVLAFEEMDSTEIWHNGEEDTIEWSDDLADVYQVEIFRNGELIAITSGNSVNASAPGRYYIILRGANGEYSAPSNVVLIANYREEASPSPAYDIAVPSTARAYTAIKMLGGASFKWNQIAPIKTTSTDTDWKLSTDGTTWSAELDTISKYNFSFTTLTMTIVAGHKYWLYGIEKFNSTSRAAAIRFYEAPTGVLFNPIVAAAVGATHSATANGIIMTALRSTTQSKGYIYLNCGGTDTNVSVVFRPILVDLTAVFGVGNEPTSVTDDRVARLKVIAEAMPQYDSGSIHDSPVESVEARGVNIWNNATTAKAGSASTYSNTTTSLTLTKTSATQWANQRFIVCACDEYIGKTMTFSVGEIATSVADASINIELIYCDENGENRKSITGGGVISASNSSKSFVVSEAMRGRYFMIRAYVDTKNNGASGDATTYNEIMLREGSATVDYRPYYAPRVYTIPSAIRALDGYGASAGNVYNYINLEPTIYHNMQTITFNGSENWRLSSVANGIANFYISTLGEKFRNTTIGALPRQNTTIANTFDEGFYYADSSTTFFRIKSTRAANVEQFKALLAASPMTFHYEATSGGTDYAARLYHRRVGRSSLSSIASSIGLSSTYPGSVYFTTGGVVRMKQKTENIIADKLTFTGVYNASTYALGQMNVQTNGTYNCWINNGAITTADARTLMESIMLNYELATEQVIDITDLIDDAAVVVDADGVVRLNNAPRSEIPNRLLFRIPQ